MLSTFIYPFTITHTIIIVLVVFVMVVGSHMTIHLYRHFNMNRQSDLNRTKRAESLKKVTLDHLKDIPRGMPSPRGGGEITLKVLVEEVIKYLMEIIEVLLQEENSNNYRNFLASSEAMHRELQRKMVNAMAEKCYEVRCQFMEKVEELERQQAKGRPPINNLKQERKNITKNILAYHRASSFNSFTQHRSQDLQKFGSQQELPLVSQGDEKTQEIGSIQLNSIQSKISALEEAHNVRIKQTLEKLERKFEENNRDVKLLTQKHVEFKLNFEEKLELSLESLWNVISDNQSKLCEIERTLEHHHLT